MFIFAETESDVRQNIAKTFDDLLHKLKERIPLLSKLRDVKNDLFTVLNEVISVRTIVGSDVLYYIKSALVSVRELKALRGELSFVLHNEDSFFNQLETDLLTLEQMCEDRLTKYGIKFEDRKALGEFRDEVARVLAYTQRNVYTIGEWKDALESVSTHKQEILERLSKITSVIDKVSKIRKYVVISALVLLFIIGVSLLIIAKRESVTFKEVVKRFKNWLILILGSTGLVVLTTFVVMFMLKKVHNTTVEDANYSIKSFLKKMESVSWKLE